MVQERIDLRKAPRELKDLITVKGQFPLHDLEGMKFTLKGHIKPHSPLIVKQENLEINSMVQIREWLSQYE
jgi:hypothetical protein